MLKRKFFALLSMLVLASMILAGCAPAEPDQPETAAACETFKAASVEFQSNIFYDDIYKGLNVMDPKNWTSP